MANRKVLSPFSFFGGKDRMAPLICDLIDYNNTNIYIEPFGGACRVLLNKPRHECEIYNDVGDGLCIFFETLGNKALSEEVIRGLYDIVPSEELFYEKLKYKLEHERTLSENVQKGFQKFVWSCNKKYQSEDLKRLLSAIRKSEYKEIIDITKLIARNKVLQDSNELKAFKGYGKLYSDYWNIVKKEYTEAYAEAGKAFEVQWEQDIADSNKNITDNKKRNKEKYKHEISHGFALQIIEHYTDRPMSPDGERPYRNDVEMAIATYITYSLSRDGIGLDYSKVKGENLDRYYNQLSNLRDVADRFDGVTVNQMDALDLVYLYCDFENVMMYLDPSYLKPEDEKKDLGKGIYNYSYTYEEHEKLAKLIQNAKAKIILSNYEVSPYTDYLDEAHGWKKIYFETNTSVGNKKDNRRVEVLWYNY